MEQFTLDELKTMRSLLNTGYSHLTNDIYKSLIQKLNKMIEDYNNIFVGKRVINKRSGKIGVILRITESDSIQVLEKITPCVICTHDNWSTLELIDDSEQIQMYGVNS